MGFLTALIVLSFLIFFHELGHFSVARFFGVHVEVFSIGFGKKIFKKIYKGTEYCISAIPLGGYVQMKGQDDSDPLKRSSDADSYNVLTPIKRILILLAGPFANLLLAFIMYLFIANMGVMRLAPIIGNVSENSPALATGLLKNDKVIEINGEDIRTWDDISERIKESTGEILLTVNRTGNIFNFVLTPDIKNAKSLFGEDIKHRIIGIAPQGETITLSYGPLESIAFAYEQTLKATTLILTSLQKLIQGVIPAKDLGGVVSIIQVTADASASGIVAVAALAALISVNLGILNLLPIPALDGGHIMFNIYELIAKKPPNENVLYKMTAVGWVFLLSLMAFTIFNDIYRIFGGNS